MDLHCHSYYSYDALSSPEELIRAALKKGLDGIAITDHNTIAGWKEAERAAEKLSAFFIPGEEITTKRNRKIVGDILGLFLKDKIQSREPFQVIEEIHSQGGVAIIAHPFHFKGAFRDDLRKYINLIDGLEGFNARGLFTKDDRKAIAFAQKNNLAITAGSDAHYYKAIGSAFTIVEGADSLDDFKKGILNKESQIVGRKSPLLYSIFPAIVKMKSYLRAWIHP